MAVNEPTTKWVTETENADGTGEHYYQCQCPQKEEGQKLEHLYAICYQPHKDKLWFWDEVFNDSSAIVMNCDSWATAETIKKCLTKGKSHWMEGAKQ